MKRILAAVALIAISPASSLFGQNAPCPSPVNFAGIRTFLSAPYITRLEDLKADIAVVGVPFDEGTWNAPGTRYGPRELREGTATAEPAAGSHDETALKCSVVPKGKDLSAQSPAMHLQP